MAYPSIIISHYDTVSITVKNLLFDYDYLAPVVYDNLGPIFPQTIEQASNYLKILMGLARSSLNISQHLLQMWKFLDRQQLLKNPDESLQLTRKHIIKLLRSKVIEIIGEHQFAFDCSKILLTRKCASTFAENAFIQMRKFEPDFYKLFLVEENFKFLGENQLRILKQVLIDCVENNVQFCFGAEVMQLAIVKRTSFLIKTQIIWIQWLLVQTGAQISEDQIRGLVDCKEEMKGLMLEDYVQMIEDITQ
ncbi:Hypothetical_protein [Hexamita inflata]|uniref:Hypothetical_protein n=1 Tax=Hexamita inflata TaxID=28002 RepID=A0ABP1HHB0_9EUKA